MVIMKVGSGISNY